MQGRRKARVAAMAAPVGIAVGTLVAFGYVGAVDPNEAGHYPTCPLLAMTGVFCPGCGGLRMAHAIAQGNLAEAASRNLLAFVLIPVAIYLWGLWTVATWRGTPVRTRLGSRAAVITLLVAVVVFSVVRNLPFGGWLAP
ncbi:DUF2752 domain-containing protein [Actinocorallia lasiicapitis]